MPQATIRAEMAGAIVKISVASGASVAHNQEVLLMESMKMEIPILAPRAGTVAELLVAVGDAVSEGQALLVLDV